MRRFIRSGKTDMGLILNIQKAIDEAYAEYRRLMSGEIRGSDSGNQNILAYGDNAQFMEYLLKEKGLGGKIKMIYIDPPFFSNANYTAVLDASKVKRNLEIEKINREWKE